MKRFNVTSETLNHPSVFGEKKMKANEDFKPTLDPAPGRSRGRFKPNQFKKRKARSAKVNAAPH
jgi:hypothetical protein